MPVPTVRLWVLSDLHLDVNARHPFALPDPRPPHDVVVIAGDLCEGIDRGVAWIETQGLNEKPVVYVAGNHEFYGRDHRATFVAGRQAAARHANIHVLERDALIIGDVTILGASLWTDYGVLGDRDHAMRQANHLMSDHRMIRMGSRAFSAADALGLHQETRDWLDRHLPGARASRARTVVVSHHAPSLLSCGIMFAGHPLNAAFASDCADLLARSTLWVHGHTHGARDYVEAGCRVVNNPRGYVPREQTGFQPDLVVTV
jgi:predicted phosphodiesterase